MSTRCFWACIADPLIIGCYVTLAGRRLCADRPGLKLQQHHVEKAHGHTRSIQVLAPASPSKERLVLSFVLVMAPCVLVTSTCQSTRHPCGGPVDACCLCTCP